MYRLQIFYMKYVCINMIFYVIVGTLSNPNPKKRSSM